MAEALPERAREVRVVAKSAGIGDHAERLLGLRQCALLDRTRGVIETNRIDEMAARRIA
jgi:hypothetical protein